MTPEKPADIVVLVIQYLILFYFVIVNLSYIIFSYLGIRSIARYYHLLSPLSFRVVLEHNIAPPISILVPAYNEEKSIVASVRSFLSLHYPVLEVIVVADGSKDNTVQRLIDAYGLEKVDYFYQLSLPCKPIKHIFRSERYPQLLVVQKENGGKADALNAAMNFAQYPIVCAVDADSILDVEALLRAAQLFMQDEQVVAVGATVHPLNGATVHDGQIISLKMPNKWIERLQILEYSRAFFSGRAGWASINALLIISGAFGLFKREMMLAIGGYATDTVTEDMELILRVHKYYVQHHQKYRILFIPDPICWTEVPADMHSLRRQRNRWHRGLWETLWRHRDMLMNYHYGSIGLLAVPYFWLMEALSPAIEVFGYVFVIIAYLTGILSLNVVVLFMLLAVLYGILVSLVSIGVETLLTNRYPSNRDLLLLMVSSVLELFGYRQILLWERFKASFQVWGKSGQWGEVKRTGFS